MIAVDSRGCGDCLCLQGYAISLSRFVPFERVTSVRGGRRVAGSPLGRGMGAVSRLSSVSGPNRGSKVEELPLSPFPIRVFSLFSKPHHFSFSWSLPFPFSRVLPPFSPSTLCSHSRPLRGLSLFAGLSHLSTRVLSPFIESLSIHVFCGLSPFASVGLPLFMPADLQDCKDPANVPAKRSGSCRVEVRGLTIPTRSISSFFGATPFPWGSLLSCRRSLSVPICVIRWDSPGVSPRSLSPFARLSPFASSSVWPHPYNLSGHYSRNLPPIWIISPFASHRTIGNSSDLPGLFREISILLH